VEHGGRRVYQRACRRRPGGRGLHGQRDFRHHGVNGVRNTGGVAGFGQRTRGRHRLAVAPRQQSTPSPRAVPRALGPRSGRR
jgi:hypothetical protein